jgi:hypothetical protein
VKVPLITAAKYIALIYVWAGWLYACKQLCMADRPAWRITPAKSPINTGKLPL